MSNPISSHSDVMSKYFANIPESVKEAKPSLPSLTSLLNFHLKKYAFSTIYANANDTPALDPLSLVSKLVQAEAGYCFHHNVAFFEAMKAMKFENMFFVAGTYPENDVPIPTHIAIVWKKDPDDWYLVDPGAGYGVLYPVPFDSSKENPGPFRIRKNGSCALEKFSPKDNEYKTIHTFELNPVSLDSAAFQKALPHLTTPNHVFYNNFWHFSVDKDNQTQEAILTVNKEGAVECELLLIDGKKQADPNPRPLEMVASKATDAFRAMVRGDCFINKHLHKAVVERFKNA